MTGATGLLGSAILKELLDRRQRVLCLVRATDPADGRQRLAKALDVWGGDAESCFERGLLTAIRGDLLAPGLGLSARSVRRLGEMVGCVIHVAGSTAFSSKTDANLIRTNVDGTRHVLELARVCGCTDWHLVSTAYVCGRCERAGETLSPTQPVFRNAYEQSKWIAECEASAAAAKCGASLTTYRPSVVVGHSDTGITTRFAGIHRVFRAVSMLAQMADQQEGSARHCIPLRIPADGDAQPNLMFVDDVAREFAEIFTQLGSRGGIFHLTHPEPPNNAAIQNALEKYYDIAGGQFVGMQCIPRAERTDFEGIFYDVVLDTAPYLLDAPLFDRTQTDRFVSRAPTEWNEHQILQQISFGESSRWRACNVGRRVEEKFDDGYAAYFQQFMPQAHPRFQLSKLPSLDLNVRYVIGNSKDGDWTCCYLGGRLASVAHTNGIPAHVTYRIAPPRFWKIVSGKLAAAEAFLAGDVQIEGDIERALKFGAVLQEFVRDNPYV